MAATVWNPHTDQSPVAVVMSDGTTLEVPALEVSGSGRRNRWAGDKQSFSCNDLGIELGKWAKSAAAGKAPLHWKFADQIEDYYKMANDRSFTTAPALDLNERGDATTVLFEYVHPTIETMRATVTIQLVPTYYNVTVQTFVHFRSTTFEHQNVYSPAYENAHEGFPGPYGRSAEQRALEAQDHTTISAGSRNFGRGLMRKAAAEFLKRCQAADDLAVLDIPDWSDLDSPKWMSLKPTRSNFTSDFASSVKLYLDTEEAAKELKAQVEALVSTLRKFGAVVTEPDNSAYDAAATGDLTRLNVTLSSQQHDPNGHAVLMNLLDGTVAVACGAGPIRGQAASAYELARFKAELSGNLAHFDHYVTTESVELAVKLVEDEYNGTL